MTFPEERQLQQDSDGLPWRVQGVAEDEAGEVDVRGRGQCGEPCWLGFSQEDHGKGSYSKKGQGRSALHFLSSCY